MRRLGHRLGVTVLLAAADPGSGLDSPFPLRLGTAERGLPPIHAFYVAASGRRIDLGDLTAR